MPVSSARIPINSGSSAVMPVANRNNADEHAGSGAIVSGDELAAAVLDFG